MIIQDEFDLTADVKRLTPSDDGQTESYGDHLSGVPCAVQPLDDAMSQDLQGSFGKDFLMFCDVQDIDEGDQVVIDEETYRVVGVDSYEWHGVPEHMELRIRRFNA